MYIFSNCKEFIRTIPTLLFSSTKPEDLDTEGEDHIADETRYMCMADPIKPQLEEKSKKGLSLEDPLSDGSKIGRYDYFLR